MALPYKVLHFLAEVAVWFEDRYAISCGIPDELILEPAHLVSSPASYGTVIYGLALVRNDKVLAYTYYLAKTAAYRACSKRAVEAEKVFIRLGKLNSIRLEAVYELPDHRTTFIKFLSDIHGAAAFLKRSLYRRMKTCLQILPICLIHFNRQIILHTRKLHTVYQQIKFIRIIPSLSLLHNLLDPHYPISKETRISLLLELKHDFHLIRPCLPVKVCKDIRSGRIAFEKAGHHIIYSMALDFLTGNRRICTADTGEYHTQVIEYLRARSNGRTWITGIDFLFDCDGRRDALDKFHIRF